MGTQHDTGEQREIWHPREHQREDYDLGAAFTILVTPQFEKIAVGYSNNVKKFKLFGGRIERGDVVRRMNVLEAERETKIAAAERELHRESGFSSKDLLIDVIPLPSEFDQQIRRGPLKRYVCFAMLRDELPFPPHTIEADEMARDRREYWGVPQVIRETYQQTFLPPNGLWVAQWLEYFYREQLTIGTNQEAGFKKLLGDLYDEGILNGNDVAEALAALVRDLKSKVDANIL